MTKDILNHVHNFEINGEPVSVVIECRQGVWRCSEPTRDTGTGSMIGGPYNSLEAYIKNVEQTHRYSYNFFKHGHKAAKESIK